MQLSDLIDRIKARPDYHTVGMLLCHNGVVRASSRNGRRVSGLRVQVDRQRLAEVVRAHKKLPGIVDILVEIDDSRTLAVGDDIMLLVVAGDIRENVIHALSQTLNAVKRSVTKKTEFFI